MKILYKPKPLPVECKRCGCLFKPKLRNLMVIPATKIRDGVKCPICNTLNGANFERIKKEEGENGNET